MNRRKIIEEELKILRLLKEFNDTINENFSNSDFGKNVKLTDTTVSIPKENTNIKSPISGQIKNYTFNRQCTNQLSIQFQLNNSWYYLEYCGITNLKVSNGTQVSKGTILGTTTNDVNVTLLNSKGERINFSNLNGKSPMKSTVSKTETGTRIDNRYKQFKTKEFGKVIYDNRYKKWNQ